MNENTTKIIVSACLVGVKCRYDAKSEMREEVYALYKSGVAIPVCPEELGGLGTPRPPCEIVGDKVLTKSGEDKTHAYLQGAERALQVAIENKVTSALLKSRSPMCGCGEIYDGSFSARLKKGNGVFAEILLKNNIQIKSIE